MKQISIIIFFSITFSACKSYSYFNSSNDFKDVSCRVYLIDGKKIDGKLSIQFETGHTVDEYATIKTGDNKIERILVTNILYYKHQNEYYFPKQLNLHDYIIPANDKTYTPNVNNLLFLKRLSGDSAKIQLFELYKPRTKSFEGNEQYDYYVSFAKENRFFAWDIRGSKFFPNFEEKVSKMVADCPPLSEKIKQKVNGYTVGQISFDSKKYSTIRKIIDEYNKCK